MGVFVLVGFVIYGMNVFKDNGFNCLIWGLCFEYFLVVFIFGYIVLVFFFVFVNVKVFFIVYFYMNRIYV